MDSTSQTAVVDVSTRPSSFWPEKLLGRRPGLKEINVLCWAMFAAFLLIPACAVFCLQAIHGNESIQRHSDFVLYYGDGTLANKYPSTKIYDPNLQHQAFRQVGISSGVAYGVSPYPPLVPYFFGLFARLPFTVAYFLWMLTSLAIYCGGIGLAARSVFPDDKLKISLFFCFAIAYFPFVGSTLVNGQLSVFAIFAVGLALYEEKLGNLVYSGAALSLLTYKPTLLLIIFPMLLLTRRFRALAGFVAGSAVLFLAGTALGGIKVWPAYVRLLEYHGKLTGLDGRSVIKLSMYLDFSSLTHLLPGGRTPVALAVIAVIAFVVAVVLTRLLWKSASGGRPVQWLAWAATLTWTLLLNVYVPIYDSVLVVIAILLTLGALRDLSWPTAAEWITLLAVVTFAVSWKTVSIAHHHGVQVLSVMLFFLGAAQLLYLHRAIEQEKAAHPALTA
jgi:Glycosyltransferase family 87